MTVEIYLDKKNCWKTKPFILCVLLLCSIFWHTLRHNRLDTNAPLFCNFQRSIIGINNASHLGLLKGVTLHRMLYDTPNIMRPLRIDVLTMTPWFAPIVWNGTYNSDILNAQFHQKDVHVGLTVFAIRNDGRKLIVLEVPSYTRWQDVSMRRMEMIRDQSRQRFIREVDYLVCVDVDMRFSDEVGVEILSGIFGTLHPGFYSASREQFTYERRPQSTAYIPTDEGDFYYAGGFFGGTVEEVYRLTNFCHNAMMVDKEKQIEAIWHDESYLNKYFLYEKPTKILSPEYLWDNNFQTPGFLKRKRFVAVPKNHNAIRYRRELMGVSVASGKFHR
ncbi:histo-blood group ABO system transferase-like isoform X5 [Pyxicephalus adspersus]|uniref:histo-blood group ABO system transferase-like isoform X5 n=1 Tax=Pyxicephalus adspersus TaxID=30357 RepID=UPI003B5B6F69